MAHPTRTIREPYDESTERPRKPRAVAVAQVLVFVAAVATPALIVLFLERLGDIIATREDLQALGLARIEPDTTAMDLATDEFRGDFVAVGALPVLLAGLAILAVVGLQRGRRWGRLVAAIRGGLLLPVLAVWAAGCLFLVSTGRETSSRDLHLGPVDPFTLNAVAAGAAFAAELLVFVLVLTRASRRWTPKRTVDSSPAGPAST